MAVTINSRSPNTAGKYREEVISVAGGFSDADTIQTNFRQVVFHSWTFNDAATVAADSASTEVIAPSASNRFAQIRLQIAGTARAGYVTVRGN